MRSPTGSTSWCASRSRPSTSGLGRWATPSMLRLRPRRRASKNPRGDLRCGERRAVATRRRGDGRRRTIAARTADHGRPGVCADRAARFVRAVAGGAGTREGHRLAPVRPRAEAGLQRAGRRLPAHGSMASALGFPAGGFGTAVGERELDPACSSPPAAHDAAKVIADRWAEAMPSPDETDDEFLATLEPFGTRFPGLASAAAGPDNEGAVERTARETNGRLGLVAVARPADAVAAIGWSGPVNHYEDVGLLAAVLRSWEDRFAAVVVGIGFDTLTLAVQRPVRDRLTAEALAAEHLAMCSDNIFQGAGGSGSTRERCSKPRDGTSGGTETCRRPHFSLRSRPGSHIHPGPDFPGVVHGPCHRRRLPSARGQPLRAGPARDQARPAAHGRGTAADRGEGQAARAGASGGCDREGPIRSPRARGARGAVRQRETPGDASAPLTQS